MSRFRLLLLFLSALLSLVPVVARAQMETPTPPAKAETTSGVPQIHIVQEGENLTYIAETYGVTVADLLAVNSLSEEAILAVGQTLTIPGGQGEAVATTYTVQVGDSLAGVAALFNTTLAEIVATNRLLNPYYPLVGGQTLSVVSHTGTASPQAVTGTPHVVALGESLLMVAARYKVSPAALAAANDLPFPVYLYPGQRLRIPGQAAYRYLPGEWVEVRIQPLPIVQGSTATVYVENLLDGRPSGRFASQPLRFTPHEAGYVALVGLDAFTPSGAYALELNGAGDRPWRPFQQAIPVNSGNYATQQIAVTQELNRLLDSQLRRDEDALLEPVYTSFTEAQQWQGLFQLPVANSFISAGYGDGRSYNGGPVEVFHAGIDFPSPAGTPVLAPANGTVVFSDLLEIRGAAVIIDHGLGVMTAYFHLSEQLVTVGDTVTTGQTIGSVGSTGLSTGAHLHWELRILGVPVNPMQWTTESFP